MPQKKATIKHQGRAMRVRIVSGEVASTPEQDAKPFGLLMRLFLKVSFWVTFFGTGVRRERIIF